MPEKIRILLDEYAGKTLAVRKIYESNSVGKRFIIKNYKDVLLHLEREGEIIACPLAQERKVNTMADTVEITFPMKKS